MKYVYAILIACCTIALIMPNVIAKENAEVFEIQTKNIESISMAPEKGTISLEIQNITYLYYLAEDKGSNKILSASALLKDIQKADVIQIQSISVGVNRQITNLILFYGKHAIPDSLKNIPNKGK